MEPIIRNFCCKKLIFMKRISVIIIVLLTLLTGCNNNASAPTIAAPVEKIVCWRCGKDLTNDHNRIETSFNPERWECTPCYEATMKEVHDEMKSEGYYDDKEY